MFLRLRQHFRTFRGFLGSVLLLGSILSAWQQFVDSLLRWWGFEFFLITVDATNIFVIVFLWTCKKIILAEFIDVVWFNYITKRWSTFRRDHAGRQFMSCHLSTHLSLQPWSWIREHMAFGANTKFSFVSRGATRALHSGGAFLSGFFLCLGRGTWWRQAGLHPMAGLHIPGSGDASHPGSCTGEWMPDTQGPHEHTPVSASRAARGWRLPGAPQLQSLPPAWVHLYQPCRQWDGVACSPETVAQLRPVSHMLRHPVGGRFLQRGLHPKSGRSRGFLGQFLPFALLQHQMFACFRTKRVGA